MEIYHSLEELPPIEARATALGNFDGIHLGHQALIRRTILRAKEEGLTSCAFTFSNHPRDLLPGKPKKKNILSNEEKEDLIRDLGVDCLVSIPFTESIKKLSAEAYVRDMVIGALHSQWILCGFNHHFGYRASGDADMLQRLAEIEGAGVTVLEPFRVEGTVVSSTLIRRLIASGRVDRCPAYLGRYYAIEGDVVQGNRLGRRIGFPTSNLVIEEDRVTPPDGVYLTCCLYAGKVYPSVTNVGRRPTFGNGERNVETHIFDFDRILYGKKIRVEFLQKMRSEKKFSGVEELQQKVLADMEEARNWHAAHPDPRREVR